MQEQMFSSSSVGNYFCLLQFFLHLNIYDANTTYNQGPTVGKLKIARLGGRRGDHGKIQPDRLWL